MKKGKFWLVVSCVVVLSLVLASCAPAAPAAPTTSTTPATPTSPTTPTTPTIPTIPTTPTPTGPEMVKVTLKKGDGTVVEKMMEKPKYGGVFTIIPYAEPRGFDPAFNEPSPMTTVQITNENLVNLDWTRGPTGTGEWEGVVSIAPLTFKTGIVAESWTVPDNQTIIYKIRKGIRFGLNPNSEASRLVGGRELTADDVAYSAMRLFEDLPGSALRARLQKFEWPVSARALDKYTVEFKSQPGYTTSLLFTTGDWVTLIAQEVVKKYGDLKDWKVTVGTGPYMIVDHVPGSSSTFIRNANYWQKDPFFPENQLPYPDGVKFVRVTDMSTIVAGFRTGKIDNISRTMISEDDMQSLLKTRPDMKYLRTFEYRPSALGLRVDNPQLPWYNLNVRRALSMAIDREAILKDYYAGYGEMMVGPVPPYKEFIGMYTPLAEQSESVKELYKYQPEKAKKLMAEAGYPNGFKMEVVSSSLRDVDLLSAVKFYLAKVGVDVQIRVVEDAVFTSMTSGRAIAQAGWEQYSSHLPYVFEKWNVPAGTPSGWTEIRDPKIVELSNTVLTKYMVNEAEVWPIMKEFFQYTLEQSWYIIMPGANKYLPWQPWVKGYSGEQMTGYGEYQGQAKYIWVDQALKKSLGF